MQKTIIQSKVTIVLQITAGQPLDAIVHDGKAYIEYPMPEGITIGMSGGSDAPPVAKSISKVVETARETKKVEDVATAKKEVATKEAAKVAKKVASTIVYTEEELMDVATFPVTKLLKICEERGIDIPKEGKNTNKKLRLLIIDAQKDVVDEEEEEEDPMVDADTPPVKKAGKKAPVVDEEEEEEDEVSTLVKLFTDFDDVEIDEKQLLAGLIDFGYVKKDAQGIIDDFNNETEMEIADFVDALLSEEEEEVEEEEEDDAPVAKTGKKKKVEFADLVVGDRVSVYFESEEDYFDGTVASLGRGGKVTVDYDDNTSDVLTKEENTTVYKK
jgi:hypothetical protein